jgi:hypothetical protein
MVTERGVEGDTRRQEPRVRFLEFLYEIGRLLTTVHVVPEHDDELERECVPSLIHLLRNLELRLVTGAIVADRGKLQRVRSIGKWW